MLPELAPEAGLGNCGEEEPVSWVSGGSVLTARMFMARDVSSSTLSCEPSTLDELDDEVSCPVAAGVYGGGREGREGWT